MRVKRLELNRSYKKQDHQELSCRDKNIIYGFTFKLPFLYSSSNLKGKIQCDILFSLH